MTFSVSLFPVAKVMHWKQETERVIIIIIIILIIVIVCLHTGNISQANGVVQLFLTEMMPKTQASVPLTLPVAKMTELLFFSLITFSLRLVLMIWYKCK